MNRFAGMKQRSTQNINCKFSSTLKRLRLFANVRLQRRGPIQEVCDQLLGSYQHGLNLIKAEHRAIHIHLSKGCSGKPGSSA